VNPEPLWLLQKDRRCICPETRHTPRTLQYATRGEEKRWNDAGAGEMMPAGERHYTACGASQSGPWELGDEGAAVGILFLCYLGFQGLGFRV